MGKNVGLTYVKDFSFPSEQGFTGSAGVHKVRGYMRGGHVKKPVGCGGAKQQMPPTVKMKGGSVHEKLTREGAKMGYAYGGQVKQSNTSAEFVAKRGKQDTMDHGVQPAQTGRNQQEVEAGGNKRLKPGYRKGGVIKGRKKDGVHRVRSLISKDVTKKLKGLKGVMSEGDRAHMRRIVSGSKGLKKLKGSMSDAERRHMSKKGMPKNVKAKGGLARFAAGGLAKKAVAAQ